MKNIDNTIAIVGPTASGKSDLAINLAQKYNGIILSVDSLSVYKEIDIASAKPSSDDLNRVKHFGVNLLYPDEKFDVIKFLKEYNNTKEYAQKSGKRVIIVGGTSFYLKVLTNGISSMPTISQNSINKTEALLQKPKEAYNFLEKIDSTYAEKIEPNDIYRLQKALNIYFETDTKPTIYFKNNIPKPIDPNLKIYEIKVDRTTLRERVTKRTKSMLKMGLIDEVAYLEHKYTREPNSMKSIGIKESLEYLDGKIDYINLEQKIITNTMGLAKRQVTFNNSQLNIENSTYLEQLTALNFF